MSDREINSFVVLCSNHGNAGCKWRGRLSEFYGHLENDCQFEMVKCPKGCGKFLQRCEIALHIKSECSRLVINCPHCLVRGEKHFIKGEHLEKCSNLPVSCPNHCGASVERNESLSEHRAVCPLEMVGCEYNDIGCNTHTVRKDIEVHNTTNAAVHLNLAKQKLACSTKELDLSKMQLAKVEDKLLSLKVTFAYAIEEVLSMITLLGQLNLTQQKQEKSNLLRQINLRYKNLFFLQGSQVAPVVMGMNDFAKHRRNRMQWFSAPFFTHTRGYQLCLCVMAAGHKDTQKGNHVSVLIAVMKGPHDSQLPWPMEGVVHIHLLNQLNSEHDLNHCMTITLPDSPLFPFDSTLRVTEEGSMKTPMGLMSSVGMGSHNFISLEKFTNVTSSCRFLKDDCIFFKVVYEKKLSVDDFGYPKSCAYKKQGSRPIGQDLQYLYGGPQQADIASPTVHNRPKNHHFLRDNIVVSEETRPAPKIPETVTKL